MFSTYINMRSAQSNKCCYPGTTRLLYTIISETMMMADELENCRNLGNNYISFIICNMHH